MAFGNPTKLVFAYIQTVHLYYWSITGCLPACPSTQPHDTTRSLGRCCLRLWACWFGLRVLCLLYTLDSFYLNFIQVLYT